MAEEQTTVREENWFPGPVAKSETQGKLPDVLRLKGTTATTASTS